MAAWSLDISFYINDEKWEAFYICFYVDLHVLFLKLYII